MHYKDAIIGHIYKLIKFNAFLKKCFILFFKQIRENKLSRVF